MMKRAPITGCPDANTHSPNTIYLSLSLSLSFYHPKLYLCQGLKKGRRGRDRKLEMERKVILYVLMYLLLQIHFFMLFTFSFPLFQYGLRNRGKGERWKKCLIEGVHFQIKFYGWGIENERYRINKGRLYRQQKIASPIPWTRKNWPQNRVRVKGQDTCNYWKEIWQSNTLYFHSPPFHG